MDTQQPNFLSRILKTTLGLLLFLLPWQTIWITQERIRGGAKWEYGTLGFYTTEILLWFSFLLFLFWFLDRFKKQKDSGLFHFTWTKDRLFLMTSLLLTSYCFLSLF